MRRWETGPIARTGLLVLLIISSGALALAQDSCYLSSIPDPGCAGMEVEVFTSGNPILETRVLQAKVTCDKNGAFQTGIRLDTSAMLYISLGSTIGSLYAEPGKDYLLDLSHCRKLTREDRMSPFYTPELIPLQPVNRSDDLNFMIQHFESRYLDSNEEIIRLRQAGRPTGADSIIASLQKEFPPTPGTWFGDYQRYRYGLLALNAGESGLADISEKYLGQKVCEDHPAYMELFSYMFRDFLTYYGHSREGQGIPEQINRHHDLDSLRAIIESHPAVSPGAMTDLVLLQELPRLFYRGEYHKEAILIILDSLEASPSKASLKIIAGEIGTTLSSLLVGSDPPPFRLDDGKGNSWGPEDALGKYCYIMFCTPEHYGCMMEYPFLQSYLPKHSEYLEIVCIMVAADREKVSNFMEQNQYGFRALYYGNEGTLLKDYRIRAYPVAFLIGPEGKLVFSPAPLPSEHFEQRLFMLMRSRGEI